MAEALGSTIFAVLITCLLCKEYWKNRLFKAKEFYESEERIWGYEKKLYGFVVQFEIVRQILKKDNHIYERNKHLLYATVVQKILASKIGVPDDVGMQLVTKAIKKRKRVDFKDIVWDAITYYCEYVKEYDLLPRENHFTSKIINGVFAPPFVVNNGGVSSLSARNMKRQFVKFKFFDNLQEISERERDILKQ